ncbi:MAG: stage III sporulation protein AA [Firmicutes bacterium]|nr:stage III sporulation protein AA [Bacillota bacterium]
MNSVSRIRPAIAGRGWSEILPVLPLHLEQLIAAQPNHILARLEEIRLRRDRPLLLRAGGQDFFLHPDGQADDLPDNPYLISGEDLERVIQNISGSSFYALEEELRNGYITLPGGHRVGLTGRAVLEDGRVKTLKYLSGLNIRVSREVKGAAAALLPRLLDQVAGNIHHTVLFSPPCCGKTTLLRDLARLASNGAPQLNYPGRTVGLVDERSEIAGCYRGVPQMDVGVRTDVLDGCPKAQGMMMLLRSMSPEIIVTDEIGKMEDVSALEEVFNAGVRIIVTIHASSLRELNNRPALKYLLQLNTIQRFVQLGRSQGAGTVEKIIYGHESILRR